MKNIRRILFASALFVLAFVSCTKVVEVETVTVSQSTAQLSVGDKVQLYATVLPSNAVNKDITWASSNHRVATITESGMVEAVAKGICEITAMAGGVVGKCAVTVTEVTAQSIKLSAESLQLSMGRSETLTATVLPDNVTDKTITWSSEDNGIATVDENGEVTAVGQGNTHIIAQCGMATAKCQVTVSFIQVQSVTLDKQVLELLIGETATLKATVYPEDASYSGIYWPIFDELVGPTISISDNADGTAKVTALYPGQAYVVATVLEDANIWALTEYNCAECLVTVKGVDAESITLNTYNLSMEVGDGAQLTSTVSPDNVTDKTVYWSSSSSGVATVSTNGYVKAVGPGSAIISASCSGKTASCSVSVSDTGGLCFEAVETGNIDVTNSSRKTIKYSFDGKTWESESRESFSIRLEKGKKLFFSGSNNSYNGYLKFFCSNKCYVSGNIMSLVSANYKTLTSVSSYAFQKLFSGNYNMDIHPDKELLLPATTLGSYCYESMFYDCTSLTRVPTLPATEIPSYAYEYMFTGCTSLQKAPGLPATTISSYGYYYMFSGCTSLISAPTLPASSVANYAYSGMFAGCTSLTKAPDLPAVTLGNSCYANIFEGCRNLIEVPKELPATALKEQCYASAFKGCSAITTTPVLPAVNLAYYCYYGMFEGCTSLSSAPSLPSKTLASYCYDSMFKDCTSLKQAPVLPATTLVSGCYRDMFYNCSRLVYIKAMFTNYPSTSYTNNWVTGVATNGTFVKNSAATWTTTGTSGIPAGWTVEMADE